MPSFMRNEPFLEGREKLALFFAKDCLSLVDGDGKKILGFIALTGKNGG